MSLARRSFLRALIGAPVAAKAVERIIANGVTPPKVEPVKPTPEPRWKLGDRWDSKVYACSGYVSPFSVSGVYAPIYTTVWVDGKPQRLQVVW